MVLNLSPSPKKYNMKKEYIKEIISFSAPAKVIFSGEHAVVYGKPALISALNMRLTFSLWEEKNIKKPKEIDLISHIVLNHLKLNKIKFITRSFNYRIVSDVPVKRRLGSSAALSVAAAAAFLNFFTGKNFSKEEINNLAYQAEKYFHKNASGVDNSASTFGGFIYYRKEFEFLKNISSLNIKLPKKFNDSLFLIDSGDSVESTGEMVEIVGKIYNQKPKYMEQILNDIEKVTRRMVVSIVKEDTNFFQRCIVDNQIYLEMLGVVSKKAKVMLKNLLPFGVGKVTGGGGVKDGSGFLLFYTVNEDSLKEYLNRKKIVYYKFEQDFSGLKQ
ncbi:MAG: hypothetical protein M1409_10930 [Actinobacteria bacterium]|nr:hypothetical protein [Actinomycetota bacterium]